MQRPVFFDLMNPCVSTFHPPGQNLGRPNNVPVLFLVQCNLCYEIQGSCRVLKGPGGVQGEEETGQTLRISVWEDWGTLGKIRGITIPLKNPIILKRLKERFKYEDLW